VHGVVAGDVPLEAPRGLGFDVAGVSRRPDRGWTIFAPGDEVLGIPADLPTRSSPSARPEMLVRKPPELAWQIAGGLGVRRRHRLCDARPPRAGARRDARDRRRLRRRRLARRAAGRRSGSAGDRHHKRGQGRSGGGSRVTPVLYGDGLPPELREAAPEGATRRSTHPDTASSARSSSSREGPRGWSRSPPTPKRRTSVSSPCGWRWRAPARVARGGAAADRVGPHQLPGGGHLRTGPGRRGAARKRAWPPGGQARRGARLAPGGPEGASVSSPAVPRARRERSASARRRLGSRSPPSCSAGGTPGRRGCAGERERAESQGDVARVIVRESSISTWVPLSTRPRRAAAIASRPRTASPAAVKIVAS